MPQMTLFAPDVTCDHCIATIKQTVGTVDGAAFLDGDPDSKSFAVDLTSGAVLDQLAEALAAEGYPLGPAAPARGAAAAGGTNVTLDLGGAAAFAPAYSVEKSAEGAVVTYNCPCGSTTEQVTFDRSKSEQDVGSCCGHHVLVQPGAAARLRSIVGEGYQVDVQTIQMPWGQPVEAAFASR